MNFIHKKKLRKPRKKNAYVSKWPEVREKIKQGDYFCLGNTALNQMLSAFLIGDGRFLAWDKQSIDMNENKEFCIGELQGKKKIIIQPEIVSACARIGLNALDIAKSCMACVYVDGRPCTFIMEDPYGKRQLYTTLGVIDFVLRGIHSRKLDHWYRRF